MAQRYNIFNASSFWIFDSESWSRGGEALERWLGSSTAGRGEHLEYAKPCC